MKKRQDFQTLTEVEYNGIKFTIHHLIIAKSLNYQSDLLSDLEEKLNKLNIHTLSYNKISFEPENLKLSAEDQNLIDLIAKHTPDWVPSEVDSAVITVKHKKAIELSDQLNSIFVNAAVLTTALLEALINLYLSIKCIESGRKDVFSIIEPADLKKKWQVVPCIFLEEYKLPFDSSPGQELKEVIDIRNSIVHYKPKVTATNGEELSGSRMERVHIEKYVERVRKIKAFLELPKKLLDNLDRYHEAPELVGLLGNSIGLSAEDEEEMLS
ncbi:hypothetical protein IQ254_15130 [Nodosilinea sp. LEGE 07088]|jgi:hypothetical protein|uniref:hypothetical protein n=1 Tax=Nodosilinea sp. LEGE 07088 TaxID=2777968 RepID=UPI00188009C9|nr:hypothetical protein [Nodosilinea sp. LEGE 07088]MBE9138507.1 hypothetical protein [Nodosilinea sp. LEGE 07088]